MLETIRLIIINRGERVKGSIIAFFEMLLYIYLISIVLIGITDDWLKLVIYIIGSLLGYFLGSKIEEKLAIGLCNLQVIVSDADISRKITDNLRAVRLAVTVVDARGKDGDKKILLIHLKRKRIDETVRLIHKINQNLVITVKDLQDIYGGYVKNK
jgi:uncharacterized protein YebE (UPF0316 family)